MTELEKDFHELKIRKGSYKYEIALEIVRGKRMHTVLNGTKWGWKEYTNDVVLILNNLGVNYLVGNDAPRGGKLGTFVEVSLANIRKYMIDKILSD